jgi:hypothetical protein
MILKWFQLPLLVLTSFWFFTFNMRWISVVRSRIFSASFLVTFVSHEDVVSINMHVHLS